MELGDTFIIQRVGDFDFLWIVTSRSNEDGGIVIFKLKPWRQDHSDESCIILPNEHPFIVRKSVVDYRLGRLLTPDLLKILNDSGCFIPHEKTSGELLGRIQRGALESLFTAQKFQVMVQASLI